MSVLEGPDAQREAAAVECESLNRGSCSKGIYMMDQQLVAITQQRGKLLHHMGVQQGNTIYLRPEEALYLVERGHLVVDIPSIKHSAAASMAELKRLMEAAGTADHEYAVYKELMNASLIVTRHPAQWLSSKAPRPDPAESSADQGSIDQGMPLPGKRQKMDASAALVRPEAAEGASEQPERRHGWPPTQPTPLRSRGPEDPVLGAEASSSSIGEWRLPHRPNLRPFRRQPPNAESSMSPHQPTRAFDVYRGNTSFSRRKPGSPLMRVHMSQSRPPSRDSMSAAEGACQGGEAVYHATAEGNHVSMYSFQPVCLPDLFRDDTPQTE